jgi:hypothetical protein
MLASYEKIVFLLALILSVYLSWRSFSGMLKVIHTGRDKFYSENL